MRALVVGSGGREHALAWKLAHEAEVFCTPGNAGIAAEFETFDVKANDQEGLVALAKRLAVDLVVVGPEDPLIAGLADRLRAEGIAAYGPGAEGARLEGSKAFAKDLMESAEVPTAKHETFKDPEAARLYARTRFGAGKQLAVKASGAALGKGVIICSTYQEADEAIASMMLDKDLGPAGETVVLETRLFGPEFSLLSIVSGEHVLSLPVAQDYKRAEDGDQGPNTGGMGAYSPLPWLSEGLVVETEERVVRPILRALKERGIDFRGTLFSGMLVQEGKPYCLEYNVRFGDPETQSVMRRLGNGFAGALLAAAKGEPIPPVEVLPNAAVTVVAASGGYPGGYAKGKTITVGSLPEGVVVFHAGTAKTDDQVATSGGRVLGVSAVGADVSEARDAAYAGMRQVSFEGMQFRNDIAAV